MHGNGEFFITRFGNFHKGAHNKVTDKFEYFKYLRSMSSTFFKNATRYEMLKNVKKMQGYMKSAFSMNIIDL